MTDQTAPDVTDDDRRIARDWAEHIINTPGTSLPMEAAAARVILNTVPAPPLPTLADMTDEERDECTGMQADAETGERVIVIDGTDRPDGRVEVLHGEIYVYCPLATEVTPRPDLPRLEWPSDQGADTSAAVQPNTVAVGSVWDDADALTAACRESGRDQIVVTESDGDVSVWNKSIDGWTPSLPTVGYEPFTIIHAGKDADQ